LFVEHADLFLKIMNQRWIRSEGLVNGMVKVLGDFGISSGNVLDLCCGNGRISIYLAKKGFKTVGVDVSRVFIEDAKRKSREHNVSDNVTFIVGDVRRLKEVLCETMEPFNVVVNAWTSIGYFSQDEELEVFKQAREFSTENAILFIVETMHSEFISLKFTPTAYAEIDNVIMLENRRYDPIKSKLNTTWAFYRKKNDDLEFIDKLEFELHVYSLNELSVLLDKAGWQVTASYGSLETLQTMTPLTSLNLVAKAK
jgi:SAM-dependent methyltransferase